MNIDGPPPPTHRGSTSVDVIRRDDSSTADETPNHQVVYNRMRHPTEQFGNLQRHMQELAQHRRNESRDQLVQSQREKEVLSAPDAFGAAASTLFWAGKVPSDVLKNVLNDPKKLNMSVSMVKDGQLTLSQADLSPAEFSQLLKSYKEDPRLYTACHDVADQLNSIFGTGAPQVAGGTGPLRQDACKLVEKTLQEGQPSVIHVKYASPQLDGHSFTLVFTGNGVANGVETLEAWAVNSNGDRGSADLASMLGSNANQYSAAVITAMNSIPDESVVTRDLALRKLSASGGVYAFEPTLPKTRTDDPNLPMYPTGREMSLKVTIRKLDTHDKVRQKLIERWNLLATHLNEPPLTFNPVG